jgi:hypothetical protein
MAKTDTTTETPETPAEETAPATETIETTEAPADVPAAGASDRSETVAKPATAETVAESQPAPQPERPAAAIAETVADEAPAVQSTPVAIPEGTTFHVVVVPANIQSAPAPEPVDAPAAPPSVDPETLLNRERASVADFMQRFWVRVYVEMVNAGHAAESAIEHANRYVIDLLDHVRGLHAQE